MMSQDLGRWNDVEARQGLARLEGSVGRAALGNGGQGLVNVAPVAPEVITPNRVGRGQVDPQETTESVCTGCLFVEDIYSRGFLRLTFFNVSSRLLLNKA
ncbi:hypothetical protein A0H81_04728 [Grifola frondosa]|uniref:Uncharacterized protein n=1 Tax=Grifola frondosa TaxID=5627 RepID=A0A1C7MGI3_GRIFR|nr:hypothetical protein A0H81_04728 [Grifola frondosa]